ncbi:hypothetical protein GHT06_002509 [Daphnia sinensis]|uniref:Transposable element P transposase-like RNase H domain-containing protein n=1 Tax=Daphnia sinensis TaxID=1820382 RepID=A0AAD5PMY2_9CRUS|nr:hypothetical protein GHT06_002509 [Daphnia sinensis]
MNVDGFVDYGTDIISQQSDKLVDHVLVFIFRPYHACWIQPIAVFATSGAAPTRILGQIILRAIVSLHSVGAIVTSVVSDGAQTNKGVYKAFGINASIKDLKFSIEHPVDEKTKIFFMFDMPHIMKCIRNLIFNQKQVQVESFLTGNGLDFYNALNFLF